MREAPELVARHGRRDDRDPIRRRANVGSRVSRADKLELDVVHVPSSLDRRVKALGVAEIARIQEARRVAVRTLWPRADLVRVHPVQNGRRALGWRFDQRDKAIAADDDVVNPLSGPPFSRAIARNATPGRRESEAAAADTTS